MRPVLTCAGTLSEKCCFWLLVPCSSTTRTDNCTINLMQERLTHKCIFHTDKTATIPLPLKPGHKRPKIHTSSFSLLRWPRQKKTSIARVDPSYNLYDPFTILLSSLFSPPSHQKKQKKSAARRKKILITTMSRNHTLAALAELSVVWQTRFRSRRPNKHSRCRLLMTRGWRLVLSPPLRLYGASQQCVPHS